MDTVLQSFLHIQAESAWWIKILLVYAGGVATSFTPCIFPLIPITVSILGGSSKEPVSKMMELKRLLSYGMGVSFSFVALGIIAVLTHSMFGALTQNFLFRIVMANIFILIGLNSLGAIHIRFFQFHSKNTQSYLGVFVMGASAGLTLSPCTLPILAIVLSIASTQSLVLGAAMMWSYAWGVMSLILVALFFGKQVFSKWFSSKRWLKYMDTVLAVLCFAVAEWILVTSGY